MLEVLVKVDDNDFKIITCETLVFGDYYVVFKSNNNFNFTFNLNSIIYVINSDKKISTVEDIYYDENIENSRITSSVIDKFISML